MHKITQIEQEGAIVERVICTISHELGNQFFPLGHFLSKIEDGHELQEGEKALMLKSYRHVEKVLRWLSALSYAELENIPYESDQTGLIKLIKLEGIDKH